MSPEERLCNWDGDPGGFNISAAMYLEQPILRLKGRKEIRGKKENQSKRKFMNLSPQVELWCLIERQSYGPQRHQSLKSGRPGFFDSTIFQLNATKHHLRGFWGLVRERKNGNISFVSVSFIYI